MDGAKVPLLQATCGAHRPLWETNTLQTEAGARLQVVTGVPRLEEVGESRLRRVDGVNRQSLQVIVWECLV